MHEQVVIALAPLLLLLMLGMWAAIFLRRAASKFKMPKDAFWPSAENPGLALQLADSLEFVDRVIGKPDSVANREAMRRVQKFDFPFIVLYVLFFASVPWARSGLSRGWIVVVALAVLTALFDVLENLQILRTLRGVTGSFPRRFGQAKWIFYFVTVAAEGSLLFFEEGKSSFREFLGVTIGVALVLVALGGITSSAKGTLAGITTATKLSGLGLLALALTPLLEWYPFPLSVTAEYIALLRVPLLVGAVLVALPFIAFYTSAKTLLRGLFDLTPLSLFVVTISALAVSGTVCVTASLILRNASGRFSGLTGYPVTFAEAELAPELLVVMVLLALPIIGFSVWFSAKQRRVVGRLMIAAVSGITLLCVEGYFLIVYGASLAGRALSYLSGPRLIDYLLNTGLFAGYVQAPSTNIAGSLSDHLFAAAAFGLTLLLYIIVGVYGWRKLGKKRTIPALCSALMLLMMLGWMLPGLTFFFDAWRIPTLLIIAAVGFVTAQSHRSDHFYPLHEGIEPAPDPAVTITASDRDRVIVVAANGGGIQAAAWTAQVLYGLQTDVPDKFEKSLRLISSVSGGSVGNGFFVNWLTNHNARRPHDAAAMSSLDEVAWGLAWPDFLRALFPWLLGGLSGRGRALERAWLLNSAMNADKIGDLDDRLGRWNEKVTAGEIPAVIMNATIAETGERLLFATTQLSPASSGGARADATELHTFNGKQHDVSVVTAARLSASFPYVTPAARAQAPRPQVHVVDGGYYDLYGMVTLVEWLDEALGKAGDRIKSVLVIQIHGAPVDSDRSDEREPKSRGWFYQAFVPLTTLLSVRTAGQVAHNNLELKFIQEKWSAAGVPIHSVTFTFDNADAPLSWHLTREELEGIRRAWSGQAMEKCKALVRKFLEGNDSLECGCINCNSASGGSQSHEIRG